MDSENGRIMDNPANTVCQIPERIINSNAFTTLAHLCTLYIAEAQLIKIEFSMDSASQRKFCVSSFLS